MGERETRKDVSDRKVEREKRIYRREKRVDQRKGNIQIGGKVKQK